MDDVNSKDILKIAINREEEAQVFYSDVALAMNNPEVKSIFERLAMEENGHKELLQEFQKDPTLSIRFEEVADVKLAETLKEPKLSIKMNVIEALALAIKKEQQAAEFYRDLSSLCNNPKTKSLCENLVNMEIQHKAILEKIFMDESFPAKF